MTIFAEGRINQSPPRSYEGADRKRASGYCSRNVDISPLPHFFFRFLHDLTADLQSEKYPTKTPFKVTLRPTAPWASKPSFLREKIFIHAAAAAAAPRALGWIHTSRREHGEREKEKEQQEEPIYKS